MYRKNLFMALALVCLVFSVQANPKNKKKGGLIAAMDLEVLIQKMPENKAVQVELESFRKQQMKQLEIKEKEFQDKFTYLQQVYEAMVKESKSDKKDPKVAAKKEEEIKRLQKELQALHSQVEEFTNIMPRVLSIKETELYRPLYEKVKDVTKVVVQKLGYQGVLPSHAFIYVHPSCNITKQVAKALGISLEEKKVNKKKGKTGK